MPYDRDDHARDAIRFPICSKGHVWKQRGERTGHCSRCHNTFEGIRLFDQHQRILDDGSIYCLMPHELLDKYAGTRFVDGSFRGPAMDRSAVSSFRGDEEES